MQLLKALLKRKPRTNNEPIFVNCYGDPLGAAGVRFKLKEYVERAAQMMPSLAKKDVSPHTFRHAAGVMLVSAGTDVTVIRSFLGHERLDTTNIYARANLENEEKSSRTGIGVVETGQTASLEERSGASDMAGLTVKEALRNQKLRQRTFP